MRRLIAMANTHRAIMVGLAAQVLQYGAALLLLPFIVTRLPTVEVGIWYVFVTVQGLAALGDFGFQPTIARSFAAAYAGSDRLHREGLSASTTEGVPNLILVGRILRTSRGLYFLLAATVLLLLLTLGMWYVTHIASREIANLRHIQIAWAVFATGTAFNIYLLWVSPFLLGANRPTHHYIFLIASRGGFAIFGVVTLLMGGGLIALALMNLVGGLVGRGVAAWSMRPMMIDLHAVPSELRSTRSVLCDIGPNAARMGLVALGGFLINRFNVLIVSSYIGLSASASYAISLQLLSALTAAALLPSQVALPAMVGLRVRHDVPRLRRMFLQRQGFLIGMFILGAAALIVVGQPLLGLIGSRVRLLPQPALILLAVILLLEANHTGCAFVITTGNRVPFVASALLSGIGVALLSVGAAAAGWGIFGVVAAQGVVQLAYNNWKWPFMLWTELAH